MSAVAGAIQAGRAYVEILGNADPLKFALNEAKAHLANFSGAVAGVGASLFAAGAGIITPILAAAKGFADSGDALDELSARTGFSTTALSELGLAMKLASVDTGEFEAALRKMNQAIVGAAGGDKSGIAALKAVGLTIQDLAALSPEQQFLRIGKAIDAIANPAERAAAAQDLFGRSAAKLLPLFQGGGAGLDQARNAASSLGLAFTPDEIKAAVKLADAFDTLGLAARRTFDAIGSAVAPIVQDVVESITSAIASTKRWIDENQGVVQSALKVGAVIAGVGGAIALAGGALLTFAGIVAAGEFVFGAFATVGAVVSAAVGTIGTVLAAIATPIGAVIALAVPLAGAFLYFSGVGGDVVRYLGEQFDMLSKFVGDVVGGIANALAAGDVKAAAKVLWAALQVTWAQGVLKVQEITLGLRDYITIIIADVRAAWEGVTNAFTKFWIDAIDAVKAAWNGFVKFATETGKFVVDKANDIGDAIKKHLPNQGQEEKALPPIDTTQSILNFVTSLSDTLKPVDEFIFGKRSESRGNGYVEPSQSVAAVIQESTGELATVVVEGMNDMAAAIADEHANALATIEQGKQAGLEKNAKALDAAKKALEVADAELKAALGEANNAQGRAGKAPAFGKSGPELPDFDRLKIANQVKESTIGGFSAAALFGLAGSVSSRDKALNDIAANTKKGADKAVEMVKALAQVSEKLAIGN